MTDCRALYEDTRTRELKERAQAWLVWVRKSQFNMSVILAAKGPGQRFMVLHYLLHHEQHLESGFYGQATLTIVRSTLLVFSAEVLYFSLRQNSRCWCGFFLAALTAPVS